MTNSDIHSFIRAHLSNQLGPARAASLNGLPDDYDLLLSGLLDSLAFVQLIAAICEFCGREIDFDALDPEQMSVVGPLCEYVADVMARDGSG